MFAFRVINKIARVRRDFERFLASTANEKRATL